MPVTIRDVALEANTSISTVSVSSPAPTPSTPRRGLECSTWPLASDTTRTPQHVRCAVAATGSLGLVIPDIANPFFPPIMKAIQSKARRLGYTVRSSPTAMSEPTKSSRRSRRPAARRRTHPLGVDPARRTADRPCRRHPGHPRQPRRAGHPPVRISLSAGIRQAVEHLKAYGHRRCAFVTCAQPGSTREVSIRHELESAELDVVEFGPYEPRFETGIHAAPLVLAEGATAVIAHNDLVALGLFQQFAALGVRVPEDVSVIGIDDTILRLHGVARARDGAHRSQRCRNSRKRPAPRHHRQDPRRNPNPKSSRSERD